MQKTTTSLRQYPTVNAYIVKLETTGLVEGEGSVGNNQVPSTVNKNVNNKTKKKNKNKNKKIKTKEVKIKTRKIREKL